MKFFFTALFILTLFANYPIYGKILPENELSQSNRLIKSYELSSINILSLNTWGLPINMPNSNNKERYQKIITNINSCEFEIICLQETFNKVMRQEIYDYIHPSYFRQKKWLENRNILGAIQMDTQGGLLTISKFPTIEEEFISFVSRNKNLIEDVGKKGFLLTYLDIYTDTVLVINTHLHADKNSTASSIRLEQLKEINSYIIKHKLNEKYPIYLAGDLNIHSSEYLHYCEDRHLYEYLKNEMKLIDPMENICEDFFTYGTSINKYSDKNSKNYKLDYILYSQSKITKPLINNDVIFKNEEALSDHCGIRCQIKK